MTAWLTNCIAMATLDENAKAITEVIMRLRQS